MTPQAIAKQCRDQMALAGEGTVIVLIVPGKWGRSDRKRLCPGGPIGHICADAEPGKLVVNFPAKEVLAYLEKLGLAGEVV